MIPTASVTEYTGCDAPGDAILYGLEAEICCYLDPLHGLYCPVDVIYVRHLELEPDTRGQWQRCISCTCNTTCGAPGTEQARELERPLSRPSIASPLHCQLPKLEDISKPSLKLRLQKNCECQSLDWSITVPRLTWN